MTLEACMTTLTSTLCPVSVGKHKKFPADHKLCLPPIATFSHHCTASPNGKLRSLSRHCTATCKCQLSQTAQCTSILRHRPKKSVSSSSRTNSTDFYYCNWPNCPRAVSKKPFKKACHLRYHMSLHTGDSIVACPECGRQFNRSYYLKQHMLTHTNNEPYICQYCNRRYTHKSEASLCRKRHKAKHEVSTPSTAPSSTSCDRPPASVNSLEQTVTPESGQPMATAQLSALELEMAIDRARVRPYACSSCPRRYTDPSSLRKHIRSHHDTYNPPIADSRQQRPKVSSTGSPLSPLNSCQSTVTEPLNVDLSSVQTTVEVSSEFLVLPTAQSSTSCLHAEARHLPPVAVTSVPLSTDSHEVFPPLAMEEEHQSNQSLLRTELTDADFALPRSGYWNSPVDLCNSAMCLQTIPDRIGQQVTDIPSSDKIGWINRASDTSVPTIAFHSCEQDNALDLTDTPSSYLVHFSDQNKAIDLSGNETTGLIPIHAYPIDLSFGQSFGDDAIASVCQQPASTTASATAYYPYSLSLPTGASQVGSIPNGVFSLSADITELQQPTELGILPPGVTPLHSHWEPEPGFSFTDLLLANGDDHSLLDVPHGTPTYWSGGTTERSAVPDMDKAGTLIINEVSALPKVVCSDSGLCDESTVTCGNPLPPLDLRLLF